MSSPNPLSNSSDIRADSVSVWNPLKRKYQSIQETVVGLAPADLNSSELLALAIGKDPNYFEPVAAGLTAKANRAHVDVDLALLTDLVNTKASSSTVTAADAALQSQLDTNAAATEAALALKASSASLAALQSSVTLDLQTRAGLDALSGFVSQLEPGFVTQAPLVKGIDGTGQRLLGIPSYDADLGSKANAADTYTKAQVDSSLALKASVASVVDGLSIKADQTSVDALSALASTLQPALVALPPLQIDGNVLQMDGSAVPLGKFRLRAQSDAVFLERYDDDGALVSDSWQTVATFGWNTDTNTSGLAVQSLSLGGEDLEALLLELDQQIAAATLTPGTVAGGYQVLQGSVVRALKANGPLRIAPDANHLELLLDESQLAATGQIAALQTAVSTKQDALAPGSSFVYHERLLEGTKVKSLTPAGGINLISTPDLVTIGLSPDLTVNTLTPSVASEPVSIAGGLQVSGATKLQGVDAAGVVAEQVVWVKGGSGAPQSVMFPGSLTLGEWRLRGTEAGTLYVERFDSDGTLVTDSWLEVARIAHNANTNTFKFEASSVSADQTFTNTLRAKDASELTLDVSLVVTGNVTALNGEFGALTATSEVLCDTMRARSENQLTIQDSLRVTGVLEAQSNVSVNSGQVAAASMFCTGDMTILGTLYGWSPFWVAGWVNGTTMTRQSSLGRVGFTFLRASGFPIGVYEIRFSSAAPHADYVISLSMERTGFMRIWEATGKRPTVNGFHVAINSPDGAGLLNAPFYFSVVV
jgi:hypothetical protein